MEKAFDFKKRYDEVHKPMRVRPEKLKCFDGVIVTDGWSIIIPPDCSTVVENVANDLQEYFDVSMASKVNMEIGDAAKEKSILLAIDESLPERTYRIVAQETIIITGSDDRALAQGCYALEDEMNLNEIPAVLPCDKQMKSRFAPRVIRSCVRLLYYPDTLLRLIAHYGIDAIEVGIGQILTDEEKCASVNDLIARAAKFGIDVFVFSIFHNPYHPDDPKAYEHYDNTYGKLFDLCPGIKYFSIVGECCEFPSKDERTTGKT